MPRILPTYTAPDASVLRGASQAATQAGRRLGSIYNEIASSDEKIARSDRAIGEINARSTKNLIWPADIAKLYNEREKVAEAGFFKGVRLRVTGVNDTFGGPSETFSSDPTQDYQPTRRNPTGASTTEFGPDYQTHYQTSRGAAHLGAALSDGGYSIADTGPGTVEYAGSNGYDYGSANPPVYYNPSPAQLAADKFNAARDKSVQDYTTQLVAQRDYWTQYYAGRGSQYQTDQTYNQAIADSVRNQGGPPSVPSTDSGGAFSGLVGAIGNAATSQDLGAAFPGDTEATGVAGF